MKIISVIGYKKSGKTDLIERLVGALKQYGRVGTVKHMHEHTFESHGTDTWKHARAGADVVIAVTKNELVKFAKDNSLVHALDELADSGVDFAVVEGFKDSTLPKIALGGVRASNVLINVEKPENADIEEMVRIISNQREYNTLNSLIFKVRSSRGIEKAGAVGTFTGIVRAVTGKTRTEFLEFEEHPEIAQREMDRICTELRQKEGIIDVRMHHRTGVIKAGEDIVYIVVAASHREQLFPVLREAVERLKAEVPIWKKEHTLEGEWWVHER
jgi:molybdopterin synthase catalytic subunit